MTIGGIAGMAGLFLAFASPSMSLQRRGPDGNYRPILELVQRFTRAHHDYDTETLRLLSEKSYIEVSPKGDRYARDRMLRFYRPDAKPAWVPEMLMGEVAVQRSH